MHTFQTSMIDPPTTLVRSAHLEEVVGLVVLEVGAEEAEGDGGDCVQQEPRLEVVHRRLPPPVPTAGTSSRPIHPTPPKKQPQKANLVILAVKLNM